MQLGAGGFRASTATQILKTLYDSAINCDAEIWGGGRSWPEIEAEHATAECRILGCSRHTPREVVRAELGLLSQQGTRDARLLNFMWRIQNMEPTRLTRQVFLYLLDDKRGNTIYTRSLVSDCLTVLDRYGLQPPSPSVSKTEWKKMVKDAIQEVEEDHLAEVCLTLPRLQLAGYGDIHNYIGIPSRLERRIPHCLERGRTACTADRLGTPRGLNIELGRWTRPKTPRCNRLCPARCGEVEDFFHFTMACSITQNLRRTFLEKVQKIIRNDGADFFNWENLEARERFSLLQGNGPSKAAPLEVAQQWWKIQLHFYRFVQRAYTARDAYC